MKNIAILFLIFACSGCAGPTSEESLQINAVVEANSAEAKAHKITYIEAATRDNAAIARIAGSRLTDDDRLLSSYRLALASQIDRGQITPETGKYMFAQRIADVKSRRQAEQAAALAEVGKSMQQTGAQIQAANAMRKPINCNSMAIGSTITTSCY